MISNIYLPIYLLSGAWLNGSCDQTLSISLRHRFIKVSGILKMASFPNVLLQSTRRQCRIWKNMLTCQLRTLVVSLIFTVHFATKVKFIVWLEACMAQQNVHLYMFFCTLVFSVPLCIWPSGHFQQNILVECKKNGGYSLVFKLCIANKQSHVVYKDLSIYSMENGAIGIKAYKYTQKHETKTQKHTQYYRM